MYIRFGSHDWENGLWRVPSGNKLEIWDWEDGTWTSDVFVSIDDTALEEGSSESTVDINGNTLTITQTLRGSEGGVIKESMTYTK